MKRIKYIHVMKRSGGYNHMVALYDDGTWEELFRFHWSNMPKIDGKLFLRKTREEAMDLYRQLLNEKRA